MIVDVLSIPALFGARPFNPGKAATSMMVARDYAILGAVALHTRPARIFEIGTYEGATSQFFLRLLPAARVISIATLDTRFNTSHLPAEQVGRLVTARERYTQLLGDSHEIDAGAFTREHGRMDLVFIDGDHSRAGVAADTRLALSILAPGGAVLWHDANHRRYREVAEALAGLGLRVAREGNMACWSSVVEGVIS